MLSKSNKYFKMNHSIDDNTIIDCKESESKKYLDTEINIEELENVPLLDSITQNYESNIDPTTFIEDDEQEQEEDDEDEKEADDYVKNHNKNKNSIFKRLKILFMNSFCSNKKRQINNNNKNSKLTIQRKWKRQELEYTWWTKFYNSIDINNKLDETNSTNKHYLKIFPNELEKQIEYNFLQDWAEPMSLIKGIMRKKNTIPIEEIYGQLKCSISIEDYTTEFDKGKLIKNYPSFKYNNLFLTYNYNRTIFLLKNLLISLLYWKRFQTITNLITETKIIVRLYIVQGINLRSKDIYGSSDSYIKVEYGKNKVIQ